MAELIPADARTVVDLIGLRVREHPDAVAIRTPQGTLTYAETVRAADRLARRLRRRGAGPGSIVALHVPRGVEALIAMVAVLRCGAAFLPLAVDDPVRRKQEVLAEAACVLTLADAPVDWAADVEVVAEDAAADDTFALARPHPQELAYAITTSGSTGRPKIVGVPHAALFTMIAASIGDLDLIRPDDTILWTAPLTADITVQDCVMALACGAAVAVPDRAELPIGRAAAAARQLSATVVDLPAAVLGPYGRSLLPRLADAGVRLAVTGGSQLDGEGFADRESLVVVNAYGPTEATVTATCYRCTEKTPSWVPIGQAIPGVRLYVLDEELNQVPDGEAGQLYIAGAGLARGYLGRPGRTAESFRPDPFAAGPGERMYATGDLVRRDEQGDLVYLGRIDLQVKVSGHRVELGEVEHALREGPGVVDAAALLRADAPGGAAVVAFVVADRERVADGGDRDDGDIAVGDALAARLRDRLPAHMVPRHYVRLAELPINRLGKVDRAALAAMPLPA